jgi:hypothetical protein
MEASLDICHLKLNLILGATSSRTSTYSRSCYASVQAMSPYVHIFGIEADNVIVKS